MFSDLGHFTPWMRMATYTYGVRAFQVLNYDSTLTYMLLGTLNGTSPALRSDGFSEPGKKSTRPLRLELPNIVRSLR
jgi:SCF-associated factor 1